MTRYLPIVATAVLAAAGCDNTITTTADTTAQRTPTPATPTITGHDEPYVAVAELQPTAGNDVSGSISFVEKGGYVRVSGQLSGLTPGEHGFHIHETGDCSAADATSAGGHYAPDADPHGGPGTTPDAHHIGDLGNIVANDDGMADVDITDSELTVAEGDYSVVDRAVIVHAGADDLSSQPSGAAGPRVACGVIRVKPQLDYTS